jgi:Flp pilus assembly pilin Flp
MNLMKFLKDEEGQSMVEYGVTLGGIAAVSYIAVVILGDKTADLYAWMANHLPGGETDEGGASSQVRVTLDGLVNTTEGDGALSGEQVFEGTNQMGATLGSSAIYEAGTGNGGWGTNP